MLLLPISVFPIIIDLKDYIYNYARNYRYDLSSSNVDKR